MANEEALSLDGLALNDGTTFGMITLSAPPPRERQNWIGAADSETQVLFGKPLHENRKITAQITVIAQSTMDLAHDKVAQIVDKLAKASKYPDGVALTWTPATGTRTVTFDVLAGEIIDLPIDWENGWLAKSPTLTIEMTCKPYWRGTETVTSTSTFTTPLGTLEVTGVTGDVPALGRLIVTDNATQSRRHVEWGVEGLYYNSGTSLLLDSDSLVTSGFAGAGAVAVAAYDPNASGNNAVSVTLTTQTMAICGTGNQSHVGTFRVKARVYSDSKIWVRLNWQSGDGPMTANAYANQPAIGFWSEVDLGTISIPPVVVGTQRWTGRIEAFALTSGPLMYVDYLTLIPVREGYGKARATYSYSPGVVVSRDDFTSTTAGVALNARVAPAGGTWATSGSATDFTFVDSISGVGTAEAIRRGTVSDASPRFAILGSTVFTNCEVSVGTYVGVTTSSGFVDLGVILRWVDSSNYIAAYRRFDSNGTATTYALNIDQVIAGTVTNLASVSVPSLASSGLRTVRAVAYDTGRVIASLIVGGAVAAVTEATSSALISGGALDDGKPGIFDRNTTAALPVRSYDDFAVATPAVEPIVVYSGRNLQVRYDDTLRQDSTGTYTGRPQSYRGSRFLVPVGTSRVAVKVRRNDIDAAPDENVTDSTQMAVGWTPRGLAIPRS
jgi:hypothetical protein